MNRIVVENRQTWNWLNSQDSVRLGQSLIYTFNRKIMDGVLNIAVLAFDGISPFHLAVPCVVFADQHPDMPEVKLQVCALQAGKLRSSAGFTLEVEHDLSAFASADLIIIPSWHQLERTPPAPLLHALQSAQQRGAAILGLCLGAYVLAYAGLLDGKRATTHWAYAEDFAARFPAIAVDADVIYIEQGQLMTSAGTAAAMDSCLHWLRQHYGGALANKVARRLVLAPHRQGGQAQFIEQVMPVSAQAHRLSKVLAQLRANLAHNHTLDSMAALAHMSRRNFSRHFQQLCGVSPTQWLLRERLARVQHLLEASDLSLQAIAEQTGFGSQESLRLQFRQRFGIAPSAWRKQFAYSKTPAAL